MATKKRFLATHSNDNFDISIFHFINNSVDVTTICALISNKAEFVFDSELGEVKNPMFIKALTFELEVQLKPDSPLDMFLMVMNGDSNYDGVYSNISGKKLLYCYVYNKIRSKGYYLQLMNEGYELTETSGIQILTLKFSDGVERLSNYVQWESEGTDTPKRNPIWTADFGADTSYSNVLEFLTIVKLCLSHDCYDSDLNLVSFDVDFANPYTYPFEFKSSYEPAMAQKTIEKSINYAFFTGYDVSHGSTHDVAVFKNAYELLKQLLTDFGCVIISEGIGKFKIVDILYKNGTAINIEKIKNGISFSKESNVKLNYNLKRRSGDIDYVITQNPSPYERMVGEKYIYTRQQYFGGDSVTSNMVGFYGVLTPILNQTINISGLTPITSPDTQLNTWGKIIFNQFMNINSPSNMTTYGFPGITIKFSIPITSDYPEIQLFYPYYFTYESKQYFFFITKIVRDVFLGIDDVECISVMKLYH